MKSEAYRARGASSATPGAPAPPTQDIPPAPAAATAPAATLPAPTAPTPAPTAPAAAPTPALATAAPTTSAAPPTQDAPRAICVEALCKVFGAHRALDQVSFELPRGAFLSIFGPNGAGKTTLLRILATLTRPSSGTVQVLGHHLKDQSEDLRARIGLISGRSMLYPDLTAEENLIHTARLYGVLDPGARVSELLASVELTARRHDVVRGFSRGMTQRLAIARALVHSPELLFLDEPYSGLDPHAVDLFDGLIAQIRTDCSHSFVMVSHDLEKGFELASHVLMLARGKVVRAGRREDLDFAEFAALYRQTVGRGIA
ncbi:MAG: ABC transporter ATP-binding protein [Coriobacteriales bacterium]|jgi:heme exporter protein A|nr:ABC transporter ATP-binding protein [Coriobacteriales bacterium]